MSPWGRRTFGEPCRGCGYSWGIEPDDARTLVTCISSRLNDLLLEAVGDERHPSPSWSVTASAYVAHIGDNLRIWAERVAGATNGVNIYRLIERASAYRPAKSDGLEAVTKRTLRMLARRAAALEDEVDEIDAALKTLVAGTAPDLAAGVGVGTDTASALLVAAGDNPERLRSEATFAHLCGASPIDASSGKQQRHRLNRGGDRQANSALWKIVLTRMVCDPRTRAYIDRRMSEGLTKKEAVRCLKRYVAREIYNYLPRPARA